MMKTNQIAPAIQKKIVSMGAGNVSITKITKALDVMFPNGVDLNSIEDVFQKYPEVLRVSRYK